VPTPLKPGQRRRPRQLRSRLMVETIVEAARQVFAEAGYTSASTNLIADRAGISIGSLYQYFPNKDALILEVQKAHHDEVLAVVTGAMARVRFLPLRDAVQTIVAANLDAHLETPRLHLAFEEWIPAESTFVDRGPFRDNMIAAVTGFLKSRPELMQDRPLDQAVFVIMTMVRSVMHASVRDGSAPDNKDGIVETLTDSILGCLQPMLAPGAPAR